jgi:hypothetical protein
MKSTKRRLEFIVSKERVIFPYTIFKFSIDSQTPNGKSLLQTPRLNPSIEKQIPSEPLFGFTYLKTMPSPGSPPTMYKFSYQKNKSNLDPKRPNPRL